MRGATRLAVGLGVLAALSVGSTGSPAGAVPGIRFTDQPRKNLLRITTPAYELLLNRKNGGILSLTDRAAKQKLAVGEGGCIWGARADGSADYIGGCSFSRTGAARFSYKWNP